MASIHDKMLMHEIFDASQRSAHSHDRLCRIMRTMLAKQPLDLFWHNFYQCTMLVFAHVDRSAVEERVVNFLCKFLLFASQTDCNGAFLSSNSDKDKSMTLDESSADILAKGVTVLNRFINICVENHDAALFKTRYRCVQFLRRFLEGMALETTLADEVYSKILKTLLQRVWDKKSFIRAEAALGLQRLQDPSSANCPAMKTCLFLMKTDSNYDVRKAALMSIALSTHSLGHVLSSTRDINEWVRKTAFCRLMERSVLATLSIAKRIQLLKDGFQDRSTNVRNACHTLVRYWHASVNTNSIEFLAKLDVEGEPALCETALIAVWEVMDEESFKEQLSEVQTLLDPQTMVLSKEKRSGEAALLWNAILIFLKKKDQLTDNWVPSAMNYCSFLKEIMADYFALVADRHMDALLDNQVVVIQSLRILSFIDLSDAYSHNQLINTFKGFFCHPNISVSLVKYLMISYKQLVKNPVQLCNDVVTMITDIRDPLEEAQEVNVINKASPPRHRVDLDEDMSIGEPSQNVKEQSDKVPAAPTDAPPAPAPVCKTMEELDINTKLKLSQIEVQLMELDDELNQHVKERNFIKAGEVDQVIKSLQSERRQILIARGVLPPDNPLQENLNKDKLHPGIEENTTVDGTSRFEEDKDTTQESVQDVAEKSDPLTLLRCNMMAVQLVNQQPNMWKLTASMRSLFESLILPSVQSVVKGVRQQAVNALGLWCSIDKPLAIQYMSLLYTILEMDVSEVKEAALRAIFDCFLVFGLECFENTIPTGIPDDSQDESDDDASSNNLSDAFNDTFMGQNSRNKSTIGHSTQLLRPIISLLDSEDMPLRSVAAQGLAKLVLFNRVVSVKLLSRLILMWFSPLTESADPGLHFLLSHVLPKLVRVRGISASKSREVDKFFARTSTLQQNRAFALQLQKQRARAVENQNRLADALFVILEVLFAAPPESPLSKIDPWNVSELILRLTDSKVIDSSDESPIDLTTENETGEKDDDDEPAAPNRRKTIPKKDEVDNPCHDNIALRVANNILNDPTGTGVTLYVRILSSLRLSSDNLDLLKDLLVLYKKIVPVLKERATRKVFERVAGNLEKHLSQKGIQITPPRAETVNEDLNRTQSITLDHLERLIAAVPSSASNKGRESLPNSENDPILLETERVVNINERDANVTSMSQTQASFFIGSRLLKKQPTQTSVSNKALFLEETCIIKETLEETVIREERDDETENDTTLIQRDFDLDASRSTNRRTRNKKESAPQTPTLRKVAVPRSSTRKKKENLPETTTNERESGPRTPSSKKRTASKPSTNKGRRNPSKSAHSPTSSISSRASGLSTVDEDVKIRRSSLSRLQLSVPHTSGTVLETIVDLNENAASVRRSSRLKSNLTSQFDTSLNSTLNNSDSSDLDQTIGSSLRSRSSSRLANKSINYSEVSRQSLKRK